MRDNWNGNGSGWLAAKLRTVVHNNPDNLTPSAIAKLMGVTRQAVNSWVTTGRIRKQQLPRLAAIVRRPLIYFLDPSVPDRTIGPGEDVLLESEVTPEQARLVLAYDDLLPEQRKALLTNVEALAAKNRQVHAMLTKRASKKPRKR